MDVLITTSLWTKDLDWAFTSQLWAIYFLSLFKSERNSPYKSDSIDFLLQSQKRGACTIKHYVSVIYWKMTNFIVSLHFLSWTNKYTSLLWSLYIAVQICNFFSTVHGAIHLLWYLSFPLLIHSIQKGAY
jgi:hypothetical protein